LRFVAIDSAAAQRRIRNFPAARESNFVRVIGNPLN